MCGIAGVAAGADARPPDADVLRAMCEPIRHRGPDDEGYDLCGGVGLGMRRLAIIDVTGGQQPLFNEDRSVRVVFNGEIYNYRELRRDLEARGHRFASDTDGEVIAHLWEEHGEAFPSRLNGMFAIALHDATRRRLLLVRDRMGIKPLFWWAGAGQVVFGSEVKALLASGRVPRSLDVDALGQFLAWEYVPGPRTLFRGVRKLEAGALLRVELDPFGVEERRWWTLPAPGDGADPARERRDEEEWAGAVDRRVGEAVRRQLVSDVPLGAFLSGGVDSSLVVAHMGETRAFSIGFDDPSYSEVEWARRVAAHLGVEHRVETIRPRVVELFDHLMRYMDDPIGDFSIFPTYLVSRHARGEVTVALSGDGGDELFGGYETYVAQQMARLWERVPGFVRAGVVEPALRGLPPRPEKKGWLNMARRFAEGLVHDPALGHARWRLFAGEALRSELFTPEALQALETGVGDHIRALSEEAGDRDPVDRALYVDARSYLTDNCLVKVDRMSMACSLEVRVPLLDQEVVELAFQVPPRLKVSGRTTKPLLKRVAARHVPSDCVYRPKEGFSIPIKHWLRDEFRPLLGDRLEEGELRRQGLFRPEVVGRLKREHLDGEANHSHVLWSLLVFHDWRERWGA